MSINVTKSWLFHCYTSSPAEERVGKRKWLPTPSSQHNSRKYNLNFIDKKFKHLSCVFYVVAPHLLAGHCDVNFTISIGWNQFNYNRIYLQTLALYNCWLLPDTRPVYIEDRYLVLMFQNLGWNLIFVSMSSAQ